MKAMIFAAGLGTRLKPLTDTMPKALVPLAGKPLLQWQVEQLMAAGITDIVVNVHHFADMIIEEVQKNNGWGANISISDERDLLLDTGGGVKKVVNAQCTMHGEPLLVCNVDILSTIDLHDLLQQATRNGGLGTLVVSDRKTQRYLCFDGQKRLCGWTNIATGELKGQDGQHLAYSGMAVLQPELYPCFGAVAEEKGAKFGLMDVYLYAMKKGTLRAYVPTDYRMMDVGKIEQIAEAERFAMEISGQG
ncbi:MAG: nucleotidyltransferase family protein [Paludibacteraceae bacterium]|nr:nucleotidyltransferase family protein [Paludibacteraceae bacterium]